MNVLDLYAGPGGWDLGAWLVGLDPVGIELDETTVATRRANGLATEHADVTVYPTARAGGVRGLIASPPCTMFSYAGTHAGLGVVERLAQAVVETWRGDDQAAARAVQEVADGLLAVIEAEHAARRQDRQESGLAPPALPRPDDESVRRARLAAHVVEPARWIRDLRPCWVALEQVPAVLPIWRAYTMLLREAGYSAWAGELNAADYGIAQTRSRAFLLASLERPVEPPEAVRAAPGAEPTLFAGELPGWIPMCEALGWPADPTLEAGFARRGDHRGPIVGGYRERDTRPITEPAQAITEKARDWTVSKRPVPDGQTPFRLGIEHALVLQSFPAGFEVIGARVRQFLQVGNAVPPLLAAHVLGAVGGNRRVGLPEVTTVGAPVPFPAP